MGQRRFQFAVLVFVMLCAQGAADALLWTASGWRVSALMSITAGTSLLAVGLLAVAAVTAFRTRRLGKVEFTYLWVLFASFLCAVTVAVVIVTSSPVSQGASRHFHWTATFIALWIAVAAIVTILSMAAVYDIANVYAVSYLLDIVSRLLRGLSLGYGAVGGRLSIEEVLRAVPDSPPGGGPQVAGLAAAIARGDAWAEELFDQSRQVQPRAEAPTLVATEVGFVRRRKGDVKMAVVNYYAPAFLFLLLAMIRLPRRVNCQGEVFWLVVRPWLPVGQGRRPSGDGHCWVRFGAESERLGVVTASRALDEPESETSGDARTASSRTEVTGRLHRESKVMKTALMEVDRRSAPTLKPAQNTEKAGFGPIRLCVGRDEFDGFVVGLTDCSLGRFAKRSPHDEPVEIAGVSFIVFAASGEFSEIGDSGSLVLDTISGQGAPYLLYLETKVWP